MPRSSEGEKAALEYRKQHRARLLAEARAKLGDKATRANVESALWTLARQQYRQQQEEAAEQTNAALAHGQPAHGAEGQGSVFVTSAHGRPTHDNFKRMSGACCKNLIARVLSVNREAWGKAQSRRDMNYEEKRRDMQNEAYSVVKKLSPEQRWRLGLCLSYVPGVRVGVNDRREERETHENMRKRMGIYAYYVGERIQ